MTVAVAESRSEGAEPPQGWTTVLPGMLVVLAIFLSPLVYDLLRGMRGLPALQ